jgi:hypothetical protein
MGFDCFMVVAGFMSAEVGGAGARHTCSTTSDSLHGVQWSPSGDYFVVVAGFMPAKVRGVGGKDIVAKSGCCTVAGCMTCSGVRCFSAAPSSAI